MTARWSWLPSSPEEVEAFVRENLALFHQPRQWRAPLEQIEVEKIDVLFCHPPYYDVRLDVKYGEERLHYYLSFTLLPTPDGNAQWKGRRVWIVDKYADEVFIVRLYEHLITQEPMGALRFENWFPVVFRTTEVERLEVRSLFRSAYEPTTNYLYRLDVYVYDESGLRHLPVLVKRYLPRSPPDRGNRELLALRTLRNITPNVYAAVYDTSLKVHGEDTVVALFTEFVEGGEIGYELWREFDDASAHRIEDIHRTAIPSLIREAVRHIVYPLHSQGFIRLVGGALPPTTYYESLVRELESNLRILQNEGLLSSEEARQLLNIWIAVNDYVLYRIPATLIHHDLMWRQILRTRWGSLLLVDLDECRFGHAAKDIADLMAANRFIAESLPPDRRMYGRALAEQANRILLEEYKRLAGDAEWMRNFDAALEAYLAFRHLHDAAYFAPVRRFLDRYQYQVEFSLRYARQEFRRLERFLY